MPNLKAIAQLLSKIRWGGYFAPPPRLNYGHTDTPVKLGLNTLLALFTLALIGANFDTVALKGLTLTVFL